MPVGTPEAINVDVGDVELGCVRWRGRPGAPVVIAVHGITANAWAWAAVARHLDGEIGLVAINLRGRGSSHRAPGPFGIRRHADDVAAVINRLGAAPALLAGHSLGAHVALLCAERHPSTVAKLVLVDGGTPWSLPNGVSPAVALEQLLGPSLARLGKIWPDRVTYHEMWRSHPAFMAEFTPEIERYVLSDLVPADGGGFRSVVSEPAVRADGTEMFLDPEVRNVFERRVEPVIAIRAETGLAATPPAFVDIGWADRFPQHDWYTVPGSNHFSVLIGEAGSATIAAALLKAAVALDG